MEKAAMPSADITLEEIPFAGRQAFWDAHIRYLVEDGIISEDEDIAYFSGSDYRDAIAKLLQRAPDRLHMLYFVEKSERIGAMQYVTYHSEDGKSVLMDFWLFPPHRNQGKGHICYALWEARAIAEGATCCQLNCERENALRFWYSLGYRDDGADEYGMKRLRKDWSVTL